MKDGKTFTDDVQQFLKARCLRGIVSTLSVPIDPPTHRAQLEDTYAKGLQKLAKNAAGTSETGYMSSEAL